MELLDPLIGRELGNCRLARRLGQGSCGVVYLGEHLKLGTPFAVKILHPILANNEESAARFLREARTAARINHENVVFIADFDIEPGIGPYFVMEFLDGQSLRQALDRDAPFSSQRTASVCEQICQPLAVAHQHGVVHRDLKPENILLLPSSGRERVKILDFGIAKITRDHFPEARELTRSGRVLGTPRYFSPEQAQGKEIDHRSDIYSFGIILYEMLTGHPAFDGQTPEEMILQHLTKMPPPLDPEQFPSELNDLISWMLAKSPNDRPDHMEEVWELLKEALSTLSNPSRLSRPLLTYHKSTSSSSRFSVVNQTSGYNEDFASHDSSEVNRTIPLGTTISSPSLSNALSLEESRFIDQENTFFEKSSSPVQQAIQQHIQQEIDLEKKTTRSDSSQAAINIVVDPSLPVEFFAKPEGEEQTATFSESTKQAIKAALHAEPSPKEVDEDTTAFPDHLRKVIQQEMDEVREREETKVNAPSKEIPEEHSNTTAEKLDATAAPVSETIPAQEREAAEVHQPEIIEDRKHPVSTEVEDAFFADADVHDVSAVKEQESATLRERESIAGQGRESATLREKAPEIPLTPSSDVSSSFPKQRDESASFDFSHLPPPPMVSEPPSEQKYDDLESPNQQKVLVPPPALLPPMPRSVPSALPTVTASMLPPPPPMIFANGTGAAPAFHPGGTGSYPPFRSGSTGAYAPFHPSKTGATGTHPLFHPSGTGAHASFSPSQPTVSSVQRPGETAAYHPSMIPVLASNSLARPGETAAYHPSMIPMPSHVGTGTHLAAPNFLSPRSPSQEANAFPSPSTVPVNTGSLPTSLQISARKSQAEVDAMLEDSASVGTPARWRQSEDVLLSTKRSPLFFIVVALVIGFGGWAVFRYGWPLGPASTNPLHSAKSGPCLGRIRIQTNPSNAEIWQKEQRLGLTPYIYRERCNKQITFQIKYPGYSTHTHLVQITDGESEVTIPLYRKVAEPLPSSDPPLSAKKAMKKLSNPSLQTVMIVSQPAAGVFHQRRYLCTTPCMVQGRIHSRRWYRLSREGYHSRLIRIRFSPRHPRYRFHLRRR